MSAALLATACSKDKLVSTSGLAYAYYQPQMTYGGPLGRLELLRQKFKVDFDQVSVCVETGKPNIADDQLLLESKLAYASWLSAAGGYDEDDWKLFSFTGAAKCHQSDNSYAGFVVLADLANADPGEDPGLNFQPEHITCKTDVNAGQKACSAAGITLGWGGPGQLQYSYYQTNPNLWVNLTSANPSTTRLSPYVNWLPFPEDLSRNTAAGLSDAQKQTLTNTYNTLVQEPTPSLAELSAFAKDLASANLVTADDPVFPQLMQQFYSGNQDSLDQDYKGQRGTFSTILHEIGHQYGMDHAHHPGLDSLTGQSDTTTQNANGQWTTDMSAMAYGLPYMYLTADDIAGVQADKAAILGYLAGKK
jgi:hypothetical protein